MRASVCAWLARAALVAAGIAVAVPHGTDAGDLRLVPVGANVRGDAKGRPTIQRDARHASTGIVRPSCEGPHLRIETRPASRLAPFLSVTVDGWLLRRGYAAGLTSVQGGRTLVGFTRHGEPATCAEVFADPAGNLWITGSVVR